MWTAGVRKEILPNGLTLLVQPDHSAPVVAVVTHVKAGFFDEPDRWTGISHVLEHMFFKGTARRGVGAIARETKSAGGYLNASTSYDHTAYFTVLPASGLEAALDIQSDALRNSQVDADELARELQVIIQEAKRKLDTPSAVAYETLHEVMFDHHRIRRWRIGHEDQLARLTRDDLWGYYRSRYVPARTIVSIVGDVTAERAVALAHRMYGEWPSAEGAVDPGPEEPRRREVRARTLRGDVSQAELVLGWRVVPPLHPDSVALDLAAAVLGSGRGSWLYRSLREPGLVTWAAAHNYAPTELGVFSVSAELRPERLDAVLVGIAEALTRLSLVGPTDEELERARTLVRARWARRLESMEGRASALAAAEALDDVSFLDREYAMLAGVSPREVREASARHLLPDAVAGVVYLPADEGLDLTPDRLARAFAVTELRVAPSTSTPRASRLPPSPSRAAVEHGVSVTRLPGADLLVHRKAGVPLVFLYGASSRRSIPTRSRSTSPRRARLGRGSWLYRSLREPGLVTWAAAHNYAPTELGVFSVSAELRPERLDAVLSGIAEGLTRLSLVGPTDEELERARTLVRARWARRLESMEGRASALAAAEALDDVGFLDREYAMLAAVGPHDVREAAARHLLPDAVAGVVYLPAGEGIDLTPDRLARAFAVTELRAAPSTATPRAAPRPSVAFARRG